MILKYTYLCKITICCIVNLSENLKIMEKFQKINNNDNSIKQINKRMVSTFQLMISISHTIKAISFYLMVAKITFLLQTRIFLS